MVPTSDPHFWKLEGTVAIAKKGKEKETRKEKNEIMRVSWVEYQLC